MCMIVGIVYVATEGCLVRVQCTHPTYYNGRGQLSHLHKPSALWLNWLWHMISQDPRTDVCCAHRPVNIWRHTSGATSDCLCHSQWCVVKVCEGNSAGHNHILKLHQRGQSHHQ